MPVAAPRGLGYPSIGLSTISTRPAARRRGGCGRPRGSDRGDIDLPQLYDGFSPFVYLWLEVLGFCPVGEAHLFVQNGGIDSDSPTGLPVLSGGGALGNGRMHGIPQMLECYLQLSNRAGDTPTPAGSRSVWPVIPPLTSVVRSCTARGIFVNR